jgi:sarcosine oxidase
MYDAVVVGLGGVGSFALRALAKSGKGGKYLGVERFTRAHDKGSSHGKTRMYRRAYFENSSYVPWIDHSLSVFRDLEKAFDVSLVQECGTLLVAPAEQGTDLDHLPPLLESSRRSALDHGVPVEFLTTKLLEERYPQLNYENNHNMVGLLEHGSGILRPELAVTTALQDAESHDSVKVMENTQVKDMVSNGDESVTLRLQTDGQEVHEITSRRVLLSMGAWTGQLLPSWAPHLKVIRQLQAWIDVSSHCPDLYSLDRFSNFLIDTPDWPIPIYGVPCDPAAGQYASWLKIGSHGRPDVVLDPSTNPSEISASELAELQAIAKIGLSPRAWGNHEDGPQFCSVVPCFYTMSPDENFLIGSPQGQPAIFSVAGLSGHGFKMTPALGQIMADYAMEKDLKSWQLDFCSASRFGV